MIAVCSGRQKQVTLLPRFRQLPLQSAKERSFLDGKPDIPGQPPSSALPTKIAIIGVGLMGGSVGMAALQRNVVREVMGIHPDSDPPDVGDAPGSHHRADLRHRRRRGGRGSGRGLHSGRRGHDPWSRGGRALPTDDGDYRCGQYQVADRAIRWMQLQRDSWAGTRSPGAMRRESKQRDRICSRASAWC